MCLTELVSIGHRAVCLVSLHTVFHCSDHRQASVSAPENQPRYQPNIKAGLVGSPRPSSWSYSNEFKLTTGAQTWETHCPADVRVRAGNGLKFPCGKFGPHGFAAISLCFDPSTRAGEILLHLFSAFGHCGCALRSAVGSGFHLER